MKPRALCVMIIRYPEWPTGRPQKLCDIDFGDVLSSIQFNHKFEKCPEFANFLLFKVSFPFPRTACQLE